MIWSRCFAAFLLLGLAACGPAGCGAVGGPGPVADGVDCYPAAAAPYLRTAASPGGAAVDPGGPYRLYIDGSKSMVGYIRGGSNETRLLPELVGMLPAMPQIDRSAVSAQSFDRSFHDLDGEALRRMETEAGYLCPAGQTVCDADDSHIDAVFARIAAAPRNELSVIVSDLWLVNDRVKTSNGVAFSGPFTQIFDSGRAIAVYGFPSPYAGRVSDLPSGRRDVTASGRYLFVLAIGPPERLLAFDRGMNRGSSDRISAALASGAARHALFTLSPATGPSPGIASAAGGLLKDFKFLTPRAGVRLPQFVLDRAAALRADRPGPGVSWPGATGDAMAVGAIWRGPVRGETRLWRQIGDNCAANGADWRADGLLPGGWADDGSFRLDPETLAQLETGTFLLVGETTRVSLAMPNPDTKWLRDWSFDAAGETEAIARPIVPTLNLDETARLLELALLNAAERHPVRLGGFVAAVRIE